MNRFICVSLLLLFGHYHTTTYVAPVKCVFLVSVYQVFFSPSSSPPLFIFHLLLLRRLLLLLLLSLSYSYIVIPIAFSCFVVSKTWSWSLQLQPNRCRWCLVSQRNIIMTPIIAFSLVITVTALLLRAHWNTELSLALAWSELLVIPCWRALAYTCPKNPNI